MEKQLFEHTIHRLQDDWMRLGLRFFGDEGIARDAQQETLLRLWVVRRRLHTPDEVKALGTKIMKNECVNIYRKPHPLPLPNREGSTKESPPMDDEANPHERLELSEERELLQWAIENLNEQPRMLLQLHLYEDMSLDEITAATGKTKGSVKTMLTRAKQQIQQWITKNS